MALSEIILQVQISDAARQSLARLGKALPKAELEFDAVARHFSDLFLFDVAGKVSLRRDAGTALFDFRRGESQAVLTLTLSPCERYVQLVTAVADAARQDIEIADGWPIIRPPPTVSDG